MSDAAPDLGSREFSFSDQDFRALAQLARAEFGLSLAESKKPLVYSRLARRLRARHISSFQDYMTLLGGQAEADERLELISALTTNVTSFFREKHHFDTLRRELLPALAKQSRIRLWSAGCSSGQEPFSIAMTLLDALPETSRRNVRILATDIDPAIVRRARAARYPKEEGETIPAELRRTWTKLCAEDGDQVEMAETTRQMISFAELNLIEPWPFHGPFDAIFCRNVAIYFDHDIQKTLWSRFAGMLRDGGFLFIGHSERVSGPALQSLTTAGVTTYRKTSAAGPAAAT
ncbi:CheR family methyltransferase [Salipiger abyssi]|uniref:CheR family methyltransferase n=1 Tax=Salipiger abyssi TaxID=1250539 RepID=UPI001A8D3630|nr:protein-glutamate O-methyltransferase CheR [Salipiger abyssi]MBN9887828.1 protein-glutamate O-methyltransferase CheR [Salipiger abyssi]